MTYSTTAIILRRRDAGEWDRLYTAYTRERGKLTLLGKGTRRPKAKLAAHLEPYAEVDLTIAKGRTIDRITFARTIRVHAVALRTYEDAQTTAFLAECVDHLTRDGHRDTAIFELLQDAFAVIARSPQGDVVIPSDHVRATIITPFLLRLLAILGYAPAFDRCVECRTPVAPGSAIGCPDRGGIACIRCGASVPAGIPLAAADREFLAAASAQFSPKPCAPAVAAFADAHLAHHLWQPLRTSLVSMRLTGDAAPRTMIES